MKNQQTSRQKKRIFLFSCGATPSRTVPKTQPLQVAFSLRERVDLRSQKEGIFGKKIAWGRLGADRAKKGCTKKGGASFLKPLLHTPLVANADRSSRR